MALKIKPIIEESAREKQLRKPIDFVRLNSDEQKPIRTDEAVSELANISRVIEFPQIVVIKERARLVQGSLSPLLEIIAKYFSLRTTNPATHTPPHLREF